MIGNQSIVGLLSSRRLLGLGANLVYSFAHSGGLPLIVPNTRIFMLNFTSNRVSLLRHVRVHSECAVKHSFHNARVPEERLSLFVEGEHEVLKEHEFHEGGQTTVLD